MCNKQGLDPGRSGMAAMQARGGFGGGGRGGYGGPPGPPGGRGGYGYGDRDRYGGPPGPNRYGDDRYGRGPPPRGPPGGGYGDGRSRILIKKWRHDFFVETFFDVGFLKRNSDEISFPQKMTLLGPPTADFLFTTPLFSF